MSTATTLAAVDPGFVVVVDTREQTPWEFRGLTAGADHDHAPLAIRTVRAGLSSGDYSIEGMENRIAIERKSLPDLASTLTHGRRRFVNELERLASFEFSAVVIEAEWSHIGRYAGEGGRLNARSIIGSILAFIERYPTTAWLTAGDRRIAAALAFRLLERFHRDVKDGKRPEAKERAIA